MQFYQPVAYMKVLLIKWRSKAMFITLIVLAENRFSCCILFMMKIFWKDLTLKIRDVLGTLSTSLHLGCIDFFSPFFNKVPCLFQLKCTKEKGQEFRVTVMNQNLSQSAQHDHDQPQHVSSSKVTVRLYASVKQMINLLSCLGSKPISRM